jgi:hypothetical protein
MSRKALDVPTYNEGTRRLWSDLATEFFTPEVQERARAKANSPEANAKKSASKMGHAISEKTKAALARGREKLRQKMLRGKARKGS